MNRYTLNNFNLKARKQFLVYLRLLLLTGVLMFSYTTMAQCTPTFSYTLNANGNVTFSLTSSLSFSTQNYTSIIWNFGTGSPVTYTGTSGLIVSNTYTANGSYTVTLFIQTASPTCSNSVSNVINVTNTPTCPLSAGATTLLTSGTTVSFNNTTTGTVSGVTYSYNFGDNSSSFSVSPVHTYSANGTYIATLTANNNFTTAPCLSTKVLAVWINTNCPVTAGFNYSLGANGNVNFFSTATPSFNLSYFWNFGNSVTSNAINPLITFTNNGTYTVSLLVTDSLSTCGSYFSQTLTINNANPCGVIASFNYTPGINNLVSFYNTSTNTVSATTYTWNFGDGVTSNLFSPSHTYTASGTYTVLLTANNNYSTGCSNTSSLAVLASATPCLIYAQYTFSTGAGGSVFFTSTSTGTTSSSTYSWTFGDGSTASGTNASQSHVYANGYYFPLLLVSNGGSPECKDTVMHSVLVTNNNCSLTAAFTHTVGSAGLVNFKSVTTGTNANTSYTWDFGDGYSSSAINPTHTYQNGGVHYVALIAKNPPACVDTVYQAVNVTGVSCSANANFTLLPTTTPQYWSAIPAYPWNVTNAVWDWGDNTSSTGLWSSHSYGAGGSYNICLSVTVSCNLSASTCATYSVYKTSGAVIYISVMPPSQVFETGLTNQIVDTHNINIYPNPTSGLFTLHVENATSGGTLLVRNLLGEMVFEREMSENLNGRDIEMDISNEPSGVYVLEVKAGNCTLTRKIVLTH